MGLALFYQHETQLTSNFSPEHPMGLAGALSVCMLRPLPGQSHFLPFPFTVLLSLSTHNSNSASGSRESTWDSQQSDSEAPAHSDTLSSISLTLEITLLQLRQWLPIGSCGFTPSGGELLKVAGLEVFPVSCP